MLNRYVESECFVVVAVVVFFIYCGFNQFNLFKRVVNVFPYPFVFRRRRNKKWKGRGKKKKRRLVSVTRLNLILQYWTKTD